MVIRVSARTNPRNLLVQSRDPNTIRRCPAPRARDTHRPRRGPRPGLRLRPAPAGGERIGERPLRSAQARQNRQRRIHRVLEVRRPGIHAAHAEARRLLVPYHVAKAAITAILLIVLIALCVLLWKAFLR